MSKAKKLLYTFPNAFTGGSFIRENDHFIGIFPVISLDEILIDTNANIVAKKIMKFTDSCRKHKFCLENKNKIWLMKGLIFEKFYQSPELHWLGKFFFFYWRKNESFKFWQKKLLFNLFKKNFDQIQKQKI